MNRFDDQRAWFCERVNENSGGLYWLAKSILHNDEDVKDAVQEAVLTAYEKLDTLRDEGSFKPWIMRILANTAYSMIRRSKPNTDIDSLAEELPAPQDEDREESMALWQAVRGLGESLRTVTVLFYIDKDGRLVVCFDEYDVAPGAMGAQSFTVSREAIAGLLR